MAKTAALYGLVTGLAIYLTFLALHRALGDFASLTFEEYKRAEAIGSIRYLLILVGIVASMLAYRKAQTGALSYGAALKPGLLTALVVAILVGAMEAVFVLQNPGFMEAAKTAMLEGAKEAGQSAAEIEQQAKTMEAWSFMDTWWGMFAWYTFETMLVGTVVSLVSAAFVRRTR